jgi:hypothetical protein
MMLMWIALFVLGYGLVSKRLERTMVTPPMVFVLLGLLFGGGSLASLGMDADQRVIHVLAELTLVLVLFGDAARIDLRALREELGLSLPWPQMCYHLAHVVETFVRGKSHARCGAGSGKTAKHGLVLREVQYFRRVRGSYARRRGAHVAGGAAVSYFRTIGSLPRYRATPSTVGMASEGHAI